MQSENESYIGELKGQLAAQGRQISDLTIDFEGCKERFDKKSDEFRDLRAKVDSIVAEKVKFETEAKKAAEQLEKAKE